MTEDLTVNCRWGKAFVRKYQGDESLPSIVALHGWLDNSASFEPMAPLLPHTTYALDLPGHGHSTHLPDGNWYHFIDYVEKTREIIKGLSIDSFILIGHSMGAAVAIILASTFPESVRQLIMIDGIGPLVTLPKETPKTLRQAILSREHLSNKKKRYFQSIDQAAELRKSVGGLSLKAATTLVKQQLKHDENGYSWTYDSKLSHKSSLRMTPDQLRAFYAELSCPTLLIKATNGILKNSSYKNYIEDLECIEEIELTGEHHLHMDHAELISDCAVNFLSSHK
ncbi:MAG: alpha/beta hydrolase [Lentisphaeraceae bacterium]|nr:alpha/beta hydrolase [Lentisphaeraceae bacterium]